MKRPEPLTAQQLVRLPAALAARLDREACLQGRSKPDLVRVAVEQMLDAQDNLADAGGDPVTPVQQQYVKRVTETLAGLGYVVLKEKSYRAAQERQRIAQVRMEDAHDERDTKQAWLERDIFPYQRHLTNRVDHLAALACRLGATREDLASDSCLCGLPQCLAGTEPSS